MPKVFIQFLQGDNIYNCRKCQTHLSNLSDLISKAFRGQHGTGFLCNNIINIRVGKIERKRLATGYHDIADIYCLQCADGKAIGWKYIKAEEASQKYKEGKFILEEACIGKERWIDV